MFSGSQLKTIRLNRQLSQADLGQLLGVNKMTISNWEKSKNVPNQKHLDKLLAIFEVSLDYFQKDHHLLLPYRQLNQANKEKVINYSKHLLEQQKPLYPYLKKKKTLSLSSL